jgi:hypothetical protein
MMYSKHDLRQAVGPLQLCGGFESVCEAAFHAMSEIFQEDDTEAMLFVDATNAFNNLNRQVTLLNSQIVCPTLAPSVMNTYRNPSELFVDGESILSSEGTTDGDPLGLAIYAIGTQPLIRKLSGIAKQAWYADDSSAGSKLKKWKEWWTELSRLGPLHGYFPNSLKTKLLVKPQYLSTAEALFNNTGIQICSDGGKYLGGALGSDEFLRIFIECKVKEWTEELQALVNIAKSQPQAAYSAFTHGITAKWNYIFRITDFTKPCLAKVLLPLEQLIQSELLPAITGQNAPNDALCEVFSLPPSLGGLGIINPVLTSSHHNRNSLKITKPENIRRISNGNQPSLHLLLFAIFNNSS